MNTFDKTVSSEKSKADFKKRIDQAIDDIKTNFVAATRNHDKILIVEKQNCSSLEDKEKSYSNLYLFIDLTGYGSIKKRWKNILIWTGFVEALAQGAIISYATQNYWLGFAVAAEEFGSEYLSWNGVDWLFGETFAPVTLEGTLLHNNKIIWSDTYFISENEEELSKKERKNKSKQLIASLHKAENKLFSSLNKYMTSEIEAYAIRK